MTIDGNVIENIWAAGQYGYAILVTPRNQSGGASWVRVRDVTISNNVVRHAAGVLQLSGTDATHVSQQTQRIALRNNLCYDIDPKDWGGSAKVFLMGEGPAGVVIDHNTVIGTNSSVVYAYGTQDVTGFVYTNNISLHASYGIMGDGGRPGQYTIDLFFPGSTITNNVLAGGVASSYPKPNSFPTVAQWNASFVNASADNYQLLSSSVFYAAGAGGSVPGVNFTTLNAALAGTLASAPPPVVEPPPPPSNNVAPVADPGGPYTGTKGTAMTVDGSGSSDADGTVAGYSWTFGDEVVVDAADTTATTIVGTKWARVSASGAARGIALHNPDAGAAKVASAASSPGSYVEIRFYAAAGVPYHVWFRMQAEDNSYTNDSMYVQFSGAVTASGTAVNRIGTSAASIVILEEGQGAGVSGWGWNDDGVRDAWRAGLFRNLGRADDTCPAARRRPHVGSAGGQRRQVPVDAARSDQVRYHGRRASERHRDGDVTQISRGGSLSRPVDGDGQRWRRHHCRDDRVYQVRDSGFGIRDSGDPSGIGTRDSGLGIGDSEFRRKTRNFRGLRCATDLSRQRHRRARLRAFGG